eukprot:TRINITY_DN758_c0_g1_i6.p1 TRINITY_DN758_c0_g1~~TRINITY_DN758_c0_g1_i6.p1  ORF type:complete len:120 (+),score=12.71 TRINITY_DN758_c0_g1_i6:12-371(+)
MTHRPLMSHSTHQTLVMTALLIACLASLVPSSQATTSAPTVDNVFSSHSAVAGNAQQQGMAVSVSDMNDPQASKILKHVVSDSLAFITSTSYPPFSFFSSFTPLTYLVPCCLSVPSTLL